MLTDRSLAELIRRVVREELPALVRAELEAHDARKRGEPTSNVALDDSQVDDLAEQAVARAIELRRARQGVRDTADAGRARSKAGAR